MRVLYVPRIDFGLRGRSIMVRMAEYRIAWKGQKLTTQALGSCVGVILYNPYLRIGGLAHCMLPEPRGKVEAVGKYVSTAIPHMVRDLRSVGCAVNSLKAAIIGGARILRFSNPEYDSVIFNIGLRNARTAKRVLSELEIPIEVEDVGGTKGRSLLFNPETGEIFVSYTGRAWLEAR